MSPTMMKKCSWHWDTNRSSRGQHITPASSASLLTMKQRLVHLVFLLRFLLCARLAALSCIHSDLQPWLLRHRWISMGLGCSWRPDPVRCAGHGRTLLQHADCWWIVRIRSRDIWNYGLTKIRRYYASAVLAPEGWGPLCSWVRLTPSTRTTN